MKNASVKYLTIIIITYMLAALAWWTLLLLKFNTASHTLAQTAEASVYTQEAIADYDKNKKMILGEGIVFAVALVTGIFLLYRSYKRELETTQKQNNFLMSVTHELKTPLSVMKLSNETMRTRTLDDNLQKKLLHIDQKEITRLEVLINNLLLSSKLDQSHTSSVENLASLLKARCEIFDSRYPNRITYSGQESLDYPLDKNLFSTAIDNLLDNALRYSEGSVHLRLKNLDAAIEISISDDGNGIPPNERKKIFEKFYRIGDENTRTTQGTGLGLFLAKSVVEAHKGSIEISDNVPMGTVFTIRLKKDKHAT